MKHITRFLSVLLFLTFSWGVSAQDYASQSAWGYGAKATGGAGGSVVTVTSMSDLVSQLKSSGKKIILVKGTLTCNSLQSLVATDKTVIGLPGATLSNPNGRDKSSSGILMFKKGTKNLILRNLIFKGAGAYDTDGSDNLCFEGVTDSWVDHCEFWDGVDGNFDNKSLTDNITISWCRFGYKIAPKSGGSGGSADHRFTNLLGSSASDKPSDGRYNITWAYCWWDEGCKERMVRGRNADIHFFNCYWNSSVANYYIGPENLKAYVEGCYFDGKPSSSNIFKSYGGSNAANFVGSYGKNGLPSSGNVSKPSYSTPKVMAYGNVPSTLKGSCGAGATLQVNASSGAVSSSCSGGGGTTPPEVKKPTIVLSSGSASQTVEQGSKISNIVYKYENASNFTIAYSGANSSKPSWLTANISGSTLTFSGTPSGYSKESTLTIKVKSTNGSDNSSELTATIKVTIPMVTPPPATATLKLTSGSATQSVDKNKAISNIVYTYSDATGANVSGLPAGVKSSVDTSKKTVTISGTPTAAGTFNYTVTTTGGSGTNPSMKGTITVKEVTVVNPATKLGKPTATYTVSGSTANVSWSAVSNASSYLVKSCAAGSSTSTGKEWNMNDSAFKAGAISSLTVNDATFTSGGSSFSFVTGKAKTYSDGFAGAGKVLQTGGKANLTKGNDGLVLR